jgi:hypothetical protein
MFLKPSMISTSQSLCFQRTLIFIIIYFILLLAGTRDLRTLWSPLVSLNHVVHTSSSSWIPYFPHWNSCEGLSEKHTHTHTNTKKETHTQLEEIQEMKFLQLLYYRETHTQRRKATNFIFILIFFVVKIHRKVPRENIHGEASVLEIFKKKT